MCIRPSGLVYGDVAGVVLGRVSHKKTGKNEVEFSVDAFQVKGKAAGAKDEL